MLAVCRILDKLHIFSNTGQYLVTDKDGKRKDINTTEDGKEHADDEENTVMWYESDSVINSDLSPYFRTQTRSLRTWDSNSGSMDLYSDLLDSTTVQYD